MKLDDVKPHLTKEFAEAMIRTQFEKDTSYRLLVEAVRHWCISHYLATGKVPTRAEFYAYAGGPNGFDWGNPPGPDDPADQPLRYKRYRIAIELEDNR